MLHAMDLLLLPLMGVVAYIGALRLYLWLAGRAVRLNLWAAGWCAASLLFLLTRLWHRLAVTPEEGLERVRLLYAVAILLSVVMVGLIQALTERRVLTRVTAAIGGGSILLVAALWLGDLVLRHQVYVRTDPIGRHYLSPTPGPLLPFVVLYLLGVSVSCLVAVWRARNFEGRARRMILGGFSLYALLGLHDVLVGAGLIQGLLLFDFAPVLVSAVLGYLLAARLIRLETDLQAEVDVQTRELRAGQDRLVALLGAVQTMMADLDLGTSLKRIVDEASRLAGAAHVALLLVERERGVLRLGAAAGGAAAPGVEVPLGSGYSGAVATSGQPLYIADMRSDPTALLAQRDRPEGAVTYLGLPVRMRGEVLGVLTFHTEAPHEYGHAELAHLGSFADQAALVLWNARMVEELKSRQARLEALIESTRQLSAVQSVGALLSRIAESCGRLLDCCAVGFRLVEGDELVVGATWGDPEHLTLAPRLPIGTSLGGRVAERGEPIVVRNLAEDERLAPEQRVLARRLGHRAWMGVPVKVGPRVLGVLGVRTKREQGFGEGDLELAMAFASQAAIALENARLLDGLGVRVKRLRTLTRVNQLISRSLDPQAVLDEIARSVARLMDAAVASFWLADESARALTLVGFSDPAVAADWPHKTLGFDQGPIGWIATQRQSLLVADVFADGRIVAPQWWERHGLKSFLGIPIALDGQLLAVLALNDRRPLRLGPEDENLLGSFAAQAAAAIRNARLYSAEAEARRQAEAALAEVKRLRGLLPICSYCKKIRNDGNYWEQIEHYISTHSEANFSHGICPDCRQTVVAKQLEAWKGAR